jgi:hypothetical protein
VKIRILPSAYKDIRNGYDFYEKQQAGIGRYFMDSIFSDIDSLQIFAGVHAIYFEKFHRMLSKRFPFAIYYQMKDNQIIVCAILDCRRDPLKIGNRLNKL